MNAHLTLALDLFLILICLFPYYRYLEKNSYLVQKLLYFDHIHHLEMKNFLFYQIQFHNQNTHIFQYPHVKVTTPNKQFFSVGSLSLELEAPSS